MFENQWISTVEALRAAIKARDELADSLMEDNTKLKKQLENLEGYLSRLTTRGWPPGEEEGKKIAGQ